MMQKMMGQMHEAGKPPPMVKMMGMCSEMLDAIRQTNALPVHCTPELPNDFGEWLKQLEIKLRLSLPKAQGNPQLLPRL
jgi:hypothetical protein